MITIEQEIINISIEIPPALIISLPPPPALVIEISNQAGLPIGGTQGQLLKKLSVGDYHAGWGDGSTSFYMHTQASDSVEWIVNHNLGRYPVVSVLSVGLVEQIAEIVHFSTNQVRIYFAQPYKGMAQCA